MAKEFKTFEQLVELMESRGITTDEQTIPTLKRESYYAIINGYKDPFLDKMGMQRSAEDIYIPGTTFRQIYNLFMFDRQLRQTMFSYLTASEAALKNAVVYAFCERHPKPSEYLERSNYVDSKNMLVPKTYRGNKSEEYAINMANLMRILNGKLTNTKRMRPFVKHYLNCYGSVPLWVLQNDLTFGNIAHFYQLQTRNVQNAACKTIGEIAGRNARLTPHDLLRVFDVLVGFRNICAHDERLYCATVKGARFVDLIRYMNRILPQADMKRLMNDLGFLVHGNTRNIDAHVLLHVTSAMGVKSTGN